MFPWFGFFNKIVGTLLKYNKSVVRTLNDSRLTDKQKVATLKLLTIHHEDNLCVDYAQLIAKAVFEPNANPLKEKSFVEDEACGINLVYSLN